MAKARSTMRSSERAATRAEKTLRLQELLDTWRKSAKKADWENEQDIAGTLIQCANELQAVLDA